MNRGSVYVIKCESGAYLREMQHGFALTDRRAWLAARYESEDEAREEIRVCGLKGATVWRHDVSVTNEQSVGERAA